MISGEVEDYCIQIGMPPSCDLPESLDTLNLHPTTIELTWTDFTEDHSDHNIRYRPLSTFEWTYQNNINPGYELSGLQFCTQYEIQVEANCAGSGTSGFTESLLFFTDCETSIAQTPIEGLIIQSIKPNPFNRFLEIDLMSEYSGEIKVQLFDTYGKEILHRIFSISNQTSELLLIDQLHILPQSIYFLRMEIANQVIIKKIVKY